MRVLAGAVGNVPRGVGLAPRLHHKDTAPRLAAELPDAANTYKTSDNINPRQPHTEIGSKTLIDCTTVPAWPEC